MGKIITIQNGDRTLLLTEKEMEVLVMYHPLVDNMNCREIGEELGIKESAVKGRLKNIYERNPWLKEEIKIGKKNMTTKIRNTRRHIRRMGNMSTISSDVSGNEIFLGQKIVRKF